jgi:hypothetical protein
MNGNTNVNSLLHHIKIPNKYVMASIVAAHHKEIKIQYDKFQGNIEFIFYIKFCIFSSSSNCCLNWTT